MTRWQSGFPVLIAALLTACGTVSPSGSGMTVQQAYGYGPRSPATYGDTVTTPITARPLRRLPWQQPGIPPQSQVPPQGPPMSPNGPTLPPGSQFPPQQTPPQPPGSQIPPQGPPMSPDGPTLPPGSQFPPQQTPPQPPYGPALDACIQTYMNGINFIMAPTEAQLASLRETARQHCLSQGNRTGTGIPL